MGIFGFVACRRRQHRRRARRRAHRHDQLALDLPRQRPDRRRRRLPFAAAAAGAHGPHGDGRLDIGGAVDRHRRADARGLRDRQRQPGRAGRRSRRSACSAARSALRRLPLDRVAVGSPLVPLRSSSFATSRRRTSSACSGRRPCSRSFFLSALYLQFVLGYSPLQVGLSFLPSNLIMAVFSIGLSAKLVMRFGFRPPLAVGLGLAAAGLRSSRGRRSTGATSSTFSRA